MPPSLGWFSAGFAPWVLLLVAILFGMSDPMSHWIFVLIVLGVLISPVFFFFGASEAWKDREHYGPSARISRWLNVLGLAVSVGLIVVVGLANLLWTLRS